MRALWTACFLLSCLLPVSCGSPQKGLPPTPLPKVICVLFDLSESTRTARIRNAYLSDFKAVLERIAPGDGIVAGLITQSSVTELRLPINENFPAFHPNTNNDLYVKGEAKVAQKELDRKKDVIYSAAQSLLVGPQEKIMKTDILSSLQVAERVFRSFSQPRKILVIMSDMIEDSGRYNFERERLSRSRIQAILKVEEQEGRVPNLKGVKVYVFGATAANAERFNEIQQFWLQYFQKCGANLQPENYGAGFISFQE
jgi:hypothetical protein